MNDATLIALSAVLFCWAILSERLAARNLTGPLVLLIAGFLLGNPSWGIVSVDIESSTVHHLAEITLALLLFADASAVPLAAARHDLPLTSRLLGIGLPLSIILGTVAAIVVFPDLPVALAGLIGASLAPTDAALSASVIADERLPIGVRRVLNVESGLNDGIATPVVTFFIASTAAVLGVVEQEFDDGIGALGQLALGIAVGTILAFSGGRLIGLAHQRGWIQHGFRRLATLSLAVLAFLVASELGGNPFVAAFVGGLVFGASAPSDAAESIELTELTGGLLSLTLWFIFGAGFVVPALEQFDLSTALYALLSLTVIRMVPVAISLLGSSADRATVLFVGWFGPRGLASVVFALLAIEELGGSDPRVLVAVDTIAITILLSVVAHGLTARPLTSRYVKGRASSPADRAGPSSPAPPTR
jgi:NhaP-type Na+/H+ or K+/H+ antiporter